MHGVAACNQADSWISVGMQGLKAAPIYTINGICMFLSWFAGRILLFMWFFCHMWQHRLLIADLRQDVQLLIARVPVLLFVLNVFWFGKIVKGLMKLLQGELSQVSHKRSQPVFSVMLVLGMRLLVASLQYGSLMPAAY